ncbi:hypothetical protein D4764_10G0007470 [Takifugu flavidus]|uniref:Uncharacterized protein n=1 Tax=Takifugu flavidus TaxID=433684 RepID=A0A5C6PMS9_9TELE|nr:hypothetical protein D4764_10G0007470 [Takifugu flavidus]
MVLSETSQEVEAIIDYITGNELSFQAALAELRAFFIKSFAKALIHNKVAEMKTKFPTTSSVKHETSLQLLANNVDSLLKDLEAEKEGQGLRLVSRAERSGFTEALVGVIYSHVIEDSEHQVKAEANYPHDPQCSDVHVAVRENVKNILVLLGWWSDAQVGNCCNRVLLTLNHINSQQREMDTHGYSDVHTDELSNANIHSNDKEDVRVYSSMDPADQGAVRRKLEAWGRLLGQHDQLLTDIWTLLQTLNASVADLLTPRAIPQPAAVAPQETHVPIRERYSGEDTPTALGSSFSERLLHPRCVKERYRRSFLPAAVRLHNIHNAQ